MNAPLPSEKVMTQDGLFAIQPPDRPAIKQMVTGEFKHAEYQLTKMLLDF